ncbi:MAG: hypothetical protein KAI33_02560, partial [Elusimicrobiales bacterium]|nr:hypothetical protein [Elusimicrobiales bacterium]
STFYNLLTVTKDTFTVYSWGLDLVNNPDTSYANTESSNSVKCKYYFRSAAPLVNVKWPSAATIQNSVSSVTVDVSAIGAGITQIWTVFVDTDSYYWTGSSWSFAGGYDPATDDFVWLSTDTDFGGTPDTIFDPPLSEPNILRTFDDITSLKVPEFSDGREYNIFIRAKNSVNQLTDSHVSPGNYIFAYDVSRPTVTLSERLNGFSDVEGSPKWVIDMDEIDGSMTDNYAGGMNAFKVYIRVWSIDQNKYLNPNSSPLAFNLEPDQGDEAWKLLSLPGAIYTKPWSWNTSGAAWTGGFRYKLEIYGTDTAGNAHGTSVSPEYTKYFRFDDSKPTFSMNYPEAGNYGLDSIE